MAASPSQLWPLLRDFSGWAEWHEAVRACRPEQGGGTHVGAVRDVVLQGGERVREQLIALSDRAMAVRWCLVGSSEPSTPYVMFLRVRPVTEDDTSFVEWLIEGDRRSEREDTSRIALMLVEGGMAGLHRRFPDRSSPSRRVDRPAVSASLEPGSREARSGHGPPVSIVRRSPERPVDLASRGSIEATAIVVERHGGPEVLVPSTVVVPPPGPGEIRVRHAAIGVNMIDVHGRRGEFGLGPLPAVPGMEAAGTVMDVGPGVEAFRPGDRIAYAGLPAGAYADVRVLPAAIVVPLPSFVEERVAAAALLKGITADLLLHDVHPVRAGEVILVHAAAGGLGLMLSRWARALGAEVIGVVSTDRKVDAAAEAGCAAVIVSTREPLAETARRLTGGRGVDVVFDAIGRDTFDASLASLAPRGHLVSFGQVSGPVGARDIDGLAARSIRLSRPNFASYTDGPEALRMRADRLFAAVRAGQVRPVIDSEWPLAQAAEAHRRLLGRDAIGSVLLRPDER